MKGAVFSVISSEKRNCSVGQDAIKVKVLEEIEICMLLICNQTH